MRSDIYRRVDRVVLAIMRERGLTEATDEIRREAYRFLAMLDAANYPDIKSDA